MFANGTPVAQYFLRTKYHNVENIFFDKVPQCRKSILDNQIENNY